MVVLVLQKALKQLTIPFYLLNCKPLALVMTWLNGSSHICLVVNNLLMLPELFLHVQIYFNSKVPQLLLKCWFLLVDKNISLGGNVIDKSNDNPSIQHKNQTGETYGCCAATRNVRQPNFEKSYLTFYSSHRDTIPYILFKKNCLTIVCFFKTIWADKSNQVYFMQLLTFLRQRKTFNF